MCSSRQLGYSLLSPEAEGWIKLASLGCDGARLAGPSLAGGQVMARVVTWARQGCLRYVEKSRNLWLGFKSVHFVQEALGDAGAGWVLLVGLVLSIIPHAFCLLIGQFPLAVRLLISNLPHAVRFLLISICVLISKRAAQGRLLIFSATELDYNHFCSAKVAVILVTQRISHEVHFFLNISGMRIIRLLVDRRCGRFAFEFALRAVRHVGKSEEFTGALIDILMEISKITWSFVIGS